MQDLTVYDVCERLNLSERTVRAMVYAGEFEGVMYRVRGMIRFHAERFAEWRDSRPQYQIKAV